MSTNNQKDKNSCLNNESISSPTKEYALNVDLLRLQHFVGVNASTKRLIILSISLLLAVISICCIIIIKNSFSISVNERYKQYGMLSSIGATKNQIKKNVHI